MTFIEFITEVMVDVPDGDPIEAQKKVKMASRMGAQRAAMAQKKQVQADMDAADASGENDPLTTRYLTLKKQLANIEQQMARKKQTQGQQPQT